MFLLATAKVSTGKKNSSSVFFSSISEALKFLKSVRFQMFTRSKKLEKLESVRVIVVQFPPLAKLHHTSRILTRKKFL